VYTSPHCQDDPSDPIVTNFDKVGDMDDINRAIFHVDRLRDLGSAGS
jgi:hypothetical protein